MQPLQAGPLDPFGAILDPAGMKVERGSHAEHQGGVKHWKIFAHEDLLFWRADTNPNDVGLQLTNPRN